MARPGSRPADLRRDDGTFRTIGIPRGHGWHLRGLRRRVGSSYSGLLRSGIGVSSAVTD
jgi:hypothetical protein